MQPNTGNHNAVRHKPSAAMVVGAGIGGMRAALDLADAGLEVFLIEQAPCLGGRVAQLGYMFPQHDCVLCRGTPDHGYGCTRPSISPAYTPHNQHPNIHILTNAHLLEVEGQAGDFSVSLRIEPGYVDPARCISCGYCSLVCPVELPDDYQSGLTSRKAIYKVSPRAMPDTYVVDRGPYCDGCAKCVEVCPSEAINLQERPRLVTVDVGAIILAVGFQTFNPGLYEELGYGRYPNVIDAMRYERLASRSGPTEGIIVRPSDGVPPRSIAWLQCIGSRDRHQSFCSSICCMFATKEAILAKERLGEEVSCSVFIMDERAFNKEYSTYFGNARGEHGIEYIRCRVSQIIQDPESNNLILQYSDAAGNVCRQSFEMVVLATGLQPPQASQMLASKLNIELNEHGFCQTDKFTPVQTSHSGIYVCGAFSSPKEIVETILDASGAAAEVMRLLSDRLNTHPYSREFPFLATNDFPPERDVSEEPERVGVFLCRCAGTLEDTLDFGRLRDYAQGLPDVCAISVLDGGCFPEGLEQIRATLRQKNLNRVVVAACSNRTYESLFQRAIRKEGLNPYLLELVNLREQCSRVHRWEQHGAQQKAQELIRLAVGRVSVARPVHKKKHRCRPVALVIGGGLSGMTAALAVADSGYEVDLVERSAILGGNLQTLHYVAEGYNPQRLCRDLINHTRAHQRIVTHTRSEVVRHDGHVGYFRTTIRTRQPDGTFRDAELEHGVTIVATGGQESRLHPLLEHPAVITQRELEEKIIHHPEEIAALKHVVMIQCVRSDGVADYCSRVCCTNALKNATRIKLFNPGCQVTVLYKNIVAYGFREQFFTQAREVGVVFLRYADDDPPEIVSGVDGLVIRVRDLNLDRLVELPADLIPLSMAITPSRGTAELARLLGVPLSSEGFFAEAQLKLRPMDFMREGIFLAGMAHYPKFIEESITHALAAAARALTVLSQRDSLYLGGVVAEVDPEKCVGCLTCTRTCPFSIPIVQELDGLRGVGGLGGVAYIDSAQCQGCGTCTGECPANAIQLVHYRDEQIMMREIQGLGRWQIHQAGEAVG